jgi:hypothetical protein
MLFFNALETTVIKTIYPTNQDTINLVRVWKTCCLYVLTSHGSMNNGNVVKTESGNVLTMKYISVSSQIQYITVVASRQVEGIGRDLF